MCFRPTGGTRTASITGGCVALADALATISLKAKANSRLKQLIASVSVGIYKGVPVLDLDYAEDSNAETDMNVVMTESGRFIEIQGTGEDGDFTQKQLIEMVDLANIGIKALIRKQQEAINSSKL